MVTQRNGIQKAGSVKNSAKGGAKLSPKQAEILHYIEGEISIGGRAPTLRQIMKHFGYSAIGTVQDHLKALKVKGFLRPLFHKACGNVPTYRSPSMTIPILGTVPAGRPQEAMEEAMGFLSVSAANHGADVFALKVKGDSMQGAGILEGDYVVVMKHTEAHHGDIVVALIDGEATVKRFEKRQGKLMLIAENPKYKPIILDPTRENLVQGKVIAVQRFIA